MRLIPILTGLMLCASLASAQTGLFWVPVPETSVRITGARQIIPKKFLSVSLKGEALKTRLSEAPSESSVLIGESGCIISLPLPDGRSQNFRVVESPMMAPELAAAFPEFRTFSVRGIDEPGASGKLDWTESGFHAMILSPSGDFFIDPYCVGNTQDYLSYYTADFEKDPIHRLPEGAVGHLDEHQAPASPEPGPARKETSAACVGSQLRTYRLAVACTGEYARAATGLSAPTVAQALGRIVTSVNRVNGVYEKELSVRLSLVASQTLIVYTDPATDPFNGNNNSNTLIVESQTVITSQIGSANFDIGHTFSTGGGGLAFLGVVCNNNSKARGITGNTNPVGDPYDIDYVAHEIGHQFGGNHTFNANTGSCGGINRNGSTSVEPGSGVTIMAYAGICPGNNVTNQSIPYFHAISYDEIVNFTQTGLGNSCAVISASGNQPPLVTTTGDYIIPFSTPFVMTGSASDPDGDPLFYSWEQTDIGSGNGANWNSGSSPFFRSYAPESLAAGETSYSRYFPKKSVVASGNYTGTIGEYLPKSPQILNFRLTARDNKPGGGGVCYTKATVTVDASGPFTVTYPNAGGIAWPVNSHKTITWDVNGTDQAPVSCDSVRILISYNSGGSYSVLLNSTPNDGSELIQVPDLGSTVSTCRIRIACIGNIFYDISNNNFTISTDPLAGIQESSRNNPSGLRAWPNPFSQQLHVVAAQLDPSAPTELSVVDLLGRSALKQTYTTKAALDEILDLSELKAGVYFIHLENGRQISVHRIIKH